MQAQHRRRLKKKKKKNDTVHLNISVSGQKCSTLRGCIARLPRAASQIALCHRMWWSASACPGPPRRRDYRQRAGAGVGKQNRPPGGCQRRRTEGSLRSRWPSDRKGGHNTAIQPRGSRYRSLVLPQGPRPRCALTAALCYLVIDRETCR